MSDNIQLTPASGYNVSRMTFSEPIHGSIHNSPVSFHRINIGTINEDGTAGDLIIPTERVFSFGVSENTNEEGKVNGYVLPMCLWSRDGATKIEKEWTDTFNAIVEQCKDHLLTDDVKEKIDQFDLERNDLKKFNPLYWKRERGKIVKDTGPTLYAKLFMSKKQNKIVSIFFDEDNDDEVDPLSLLGRYCFARGAIKFESIFIGNKISLQVKLYEAGVKLMQKSMKRLLVRPKANPQVLSAANPLAIKHEDDEADEPIQDQEQNDSDKEDGEEAKVPVKKRIVKKVLRKKP